MNKPTIKFSHRYTKMPHGVEYLETWIKDIAIVDYKDLTPEQIEQDTAIVGGGNYQLPNSRLIWIKLWSDSIPKPTEWGTMRRWTPDKEKYYRSLLGQEVAILIEEIKVC